MRSPGNPGSLRRTPWVGVDVGGDRSTPPSAGSAGNTTSTSRSTTATQASSTASTRSASSPAPTRCARSCSTRGGSARPRRSSSANGSSSPRSRKPACASSPPPTASTTAFAHHARGAHPCARERSLQRDTTTQRGYGSEHRARARAAITAEPWCGRCGSGTDLTADHSHHSHSAAAPLGPLRVLCRRCSSGWRRDELRLIQIRRWAPTHPAPEPTQDVIEQRRTGRLALAAAAGEVAGMTVARGARHRVAALELAR